eukprot:436642_1
MALLEGMDTPEQNDDEKALLSSTVRTASSEDPLINLLRVNNLYDDLYQILHDNDIDLEMMENDVPQDEIDQFCQEFGFKYKQKLKFRRLMRVIYELKKTNSNVNDNNTNDFDAQLQAYRQQQKNKQQNDYVTEGENHTRLTPQQPPDPFYEVKYDLQMQIAMQQNYAKEMRKKKETDYEEKMAIKKGQDYLAKKDLKPSMKMEVALIGDSDVGKTCLMRKYTRGIFSEGIAYSIGVDSMVKIEKLHDNTLMEITVRDTAGQERYQSLCRNYYRGADAIIVCYDVNNDKSFGNCDRWRNRIEEYGNDEVVVILVGCKGDISTNNYFRQLVDAKAQSIVSQEKWKKFKALYCECSAKTGDNVRNVFITAAEMVLENRIRRRSHIAARDRIVPQIVRLERAQAQPNNNQTIFAKCAAFCGL